MAGRRKKQTSRRPAAGTPTREEALVAREEAVEAHEGQLESREQTAVDVRAEFEALMDALREANGHLVLANVRSQSLAEQMNLQVHAYAPAYSERDVDREI